MQNATEDQRGLFKCWALAAAPAGFASKGICPLHPADLITPVLLQDSQGTALPCSSTLGTPQAPKGEGRRGASQVLRFNPHLFRRWIFLGGFASTLSSTNPRTEILERVQQNWRQDRASHGSGYSEIFPSGLTYRTQSSNLKSGRARGEQETETPWMESSEKRLHRTQHMHIFPRPRHPAGEGGGEEKL